MFKKLSITIVAALSALSLALLAGCSMDHSGDTQQMTTASKPASPPTRADFLSNNPQIPAAAKKNLAHNIPGMSTTP